MISGAPRTAADGRRVVFGPFRLDVAGRRLTRDGVVVALGARALDLLIALASRPGEVLGRDELVAAVWPRLTVEDTNLRTQVSLLRRGLGHGHYIATVPSRGYSFVASVEYEPGGPDAASWRAPALRTPLIGRRPVLRMLLDRLRHTRLLTITGLGGIGKTTVALALAAATEDRFPDGVAFVDLAGASDPGAALAQALGLVIAPGEATAGLAAWFRPRRMMVLLDSCEHTAAPTAELADQIMAAAAGVTILATSREALRVSGETVWRLDPLPTPPDGVGTDAAGAMAYGAVELFVERASAALGGYVLSDKDALVVASICRRLDGLPLAIELAAGRLPGLGVRGLSDALDDRLRLLSQGWRTAQPRHQTMQAALEWSYKALSPSEQAAFRRLSLFVGPFAVAGATAVVGGADLDPGDAAYLLADLVAKSLVTADPKPEGTEYRLLDTTRDYALAALQGDERKAASHRHARYTIEVLSQAEAELTRRSKLDWVAHYGQQLSNLRAALDWALGPDGDRELAVRATLAAAPVWARLSQHDECGAWCGKMLSIVDPESRDAMRLNAELGNALFADPAATERVEDAWRGATSLARHFGDSAMLLRSHWGLWNAYAYHGRMREAGPLSRSFCDLARRHGGAYERAVADRLLAASLSLEGDHEGARVAAERVLGSETSAAAPAPLGWYSFNPHTMALNTLVTCWWTQGQFRRAAAASAQAALDALESDHDFSICAVLADNACPIHLLIGDFPAAERYAALLGERARQSGIGLYSRWVEAFEAVLATSGGDADAGLRLLNSGRLSEAGHPRFMAPLATLALNLSKVGARRQGQALADNLLARCEASGQRWIWPEVQRVRGELSEDSAQSVALIRAAFDEAMRQDAPAWALRAAVSLAPRSPAEGAALLALLLNRFVDELETPELLFARDHIARGVEPRESRA